MSASCVEVVEYRRLDATNFKVGDLSLKIRAHLTISCPTKFANARYDENGQFLITKY